ncbi:MAG: toprim domain-containing protein [Gammaproteobacteria bacterium]|nr:toprim domain-containing protein [Gammaproteobacteria bacterium]
MDLTSIFPGGFSATPLVRENTSRPGNDSPSFFELAHNSGLIINTSILDGKIHRVPVAGDKQSKKSGWYVYFDGDFPAGSFGNWKTGETQTWSQHDKASLSLGDQERQRITIEAANRAAEKERDRLHEAAAQTAAAIINAMVPIKDHPYLQSKGIEPTGLVGCAEDGRLVVPMVTVDGELVSLQYISGNGSKQYLKGGRKGMFVINPDSDPRKIYIVEGYATGVTVAEATGGMTAVAFDTSNLKTTAKQLKDKYPTAQIIIAADNDQFTENNPGLTYAQIAAEQTNGTVIHPEFIDLSNKPTDFNDLQQQSGIDTVRNQ